MTKIAPLLRELLFYLKIALSCLVLQQLFHLALGGRQLSFPAQVLLVWFVGSASFYAYGFTLEAIRKHPRLRARFNVRQDHVRPQPYPPFTALGVLRGELKSLLLVTAVLAPATEVHRSNDPLRNAAWFLLQIAVADIAVYCVHRALHTRALHFIHRKHHEYRDTSTWVAAYKTTLELVLFTFADLIPIYLFHFDLAQLCAWIAIGTCYNLEGHSSLSVLFIPSDFHDRHHTAYRGNFGIQGFWDRVFGTLLPPARSAPR